MTKRDYSLSLRVVLTMYEQQVGKRHQSVEVHIQHHYVKIILTPQPNSD